MLHGRAQFVVADPERPMFHCTAMSRSAGIVLTLSCFVAAGCAGIRHAQTTESVPVAQPPAPIAVVEEAPVPAAPQLEVAPAVAEAPVLPAPPPVQPVRPVEAAPAARAEVPTVPASRVAPATTVASPKPPPRPVAAVTAVTVPPPQAMPKAAAVPAAPLDFKALASRLRETRAIGVLTKLALKNEVDDLVDRFRAYHKRQGTATLAELRRNYDMLLLKVLSLLQDSDPPLARDIGKSRAAIWSILEDPRKFTESNLMAGATP
jgi:hypothetical protein